MSLPYNMRGSIAITDISDVITELAKAEVNLGDDEPGVSSYLVCVCSSVLEVKWNGH